MSEFQESETPEKDFNDKVRAIFESTETETEDVATDEEVVEEDLTEEVEATEDESLVETEEVADVEEVKTPVKTSKEQAAIIALKRELKELRELAKIAAVKEEETAVVKEKDEIVKQYLNEGYDKETAERNATQDLKISQIEKRVAVSDFKAENAAILNKYPQAATEIEKIMKNVKATGLSVDAMCYAMYKDTINVAQERAKAAVTGELKGKSADSIGSATRTAATATSVTLSSADKAKKKDFEAKMKFTVSDKRYLELKDTYNL